MLLGYQPTRSASRHWWTSTSQQTSRHSNIISAWRDGWGTNFYTIPSEQTSCKLRRQNYQKVPQLKAATNESDSPKRRLSRKGKIFSTRSIPYRMRFQVQISLSTFPISGVSTLMSTPRKEATGSWYTMSKETPLEINNLKGTLDPSYLYLNP